VSRIIQALNVNDAFMEGWWHLKTEGVAEQSRNGPVLVSPGMVVTEYYHPLERVLFDQRRDANHVFHLMESIWMLAGRNDVAWLEQFNSGYGRYADDGVVHGAYGHRWRNAFSQDQLPYIAGLLQRDPQSRQAVLQMWDCNEYDLTGPWKDRPCNTHVYFDCRGLRLNMTVCCRSNDMLWGAYGANVVHFSILQEVLAAQVGVPVGIYRQVSNNFHVYTDLPMVKDYIDNPPLRAYDPYETGLVAPFPIMDTKVINGLQGFLADCEDFCDGEQTRTQFLTEVATPLRDAYLARKAGHDTDLRAVPHCDWKHGYELWLKNRSKK
jgi:thymidylate synthase